MKTIKNNIKINIGFPQKRAKDCCIQTLLHTYKSQNNK